MSDVAAQLAALAEKALGCPLPVRVRAWDGSEAGPPGTPTLVVRHRRALRRVLWKPGELGLARAWVAGEIDFDGDLYEALALLAGALVHPEGPGRGPYPVTARPRNHGVRSALLHDGGVRSAARELLALARPWPPPPPPREEVRRRTGIRHSLRRDRQAIGHHYDVGNDFYRLVLGPSMTYSCAYWPDDPRAATTGTDKATKATDRAPSRRTDKATKATDRTPHRTDEATTGTDREATGAASGSTYDSYDCDSYGGFAGHGAAPDAAPTLEQAQHDKLDLICRKLDLKPGDRLLDVGCGWGSLVLHAAQEYGVQAVGITLSQEQAAYGRKRIAEAGLTDRVDIRVQDYRETDDGPFDAISSVGMAEHVGSVRYRQYADTLYALLRKGGRLLNHQIARRPQEDEAAYRVSRFIDAYVFPDGELAPVGTTVGILESAGFEVRDLEALREHYALTLRCWVANLEAHWREAVRLSSPGRARVWRLYMAASALAFEQRSIGVNQVLAVRTSPSGVSGLPLRTRDWRA